MLAAGRRTAATCNRDALYPSPLKFPLPFLSSFAFAGDAGALLHLLTFAAYEYQDSDLGCALTQAYLSNQLLGLKLDHDGEYFADLRDVSKVDVQFTEDAVLVRKQRPCVVAASYIDYGRVLRASFGDTLWSRKQTLEALGYEALGFRLETKYLPFAIVCILLALAIVLYTIRLLGKLN